MRTGVVAKKIGMSRYYTQDGIDIPVTLLQVEACPVVAVKTKASDGYCAVQLGFGKRKIKNVSKPLRGHFAKAKVKPGAGVVEFRVSEDAILVPGQEVCINHYVVGQYVDIAGITIGKGFAGVMKRHGFSGLEATHGVSVSHRSHGSTGQRQDPGKVFKGKKMAGHMGSVRVTVQNLKVVQIDEGNGLLLVCGAVPGKKGSNVLIYDAVKKVLPSAAPFPAGIYCADKAEAVEEVAD